MSDELDLGAYFRRIGYGGPARPDLATLAALHARQVDAMPFESLDPLLGRPVRLDAASLQAKLVGQRRGGYCFELNALFKAALDAIGFAVTGLGGRVRWMSPPAAPLGARSHMLLKVDLPEGPYLADVGFGGHLLDAPLRLAVGLEQTTPAGRYRLELQNDLHALQVSTGGDWRCAYVFNLEPQLPADYAVANWFTSTHPEVLFTSTLLAERLTEGARYNLVNARLTETPRGGPASERMLASPAEFGEALEGLFGVAPPAPIGEIFAKVTATA
jgi:N-hydroxyarylamine O-acetyltransferase